MQPKDLLAQALPWLGAAATGNVPALIALAAEKIGAALGAKVEAKPEAIAQAVSGATPEQMIALRKLDTDFQRDMQLAGYKDAEDLRHVELEKDKLYVEDTDKARHAFATDKGVFRLGVVILLTFALIMGLSIYGAFRLLLDDDLKTVDPGVVAAVFGFLGTIVGYVAANANQVISYFFGSSRGSNDKSRDMAEAFKGLAKRGN